MTSGLKSGAHLIIASISFFDAGFASSVFSTLCNAVKTVPLS